jgi:hypothetical protein
LGAEHAISFYSVTSWSRLRGLPVTMRQEKARLALTSEAQARPEQEAGQKELRAGGLPDTRLEKRSRD